MNTKIYKTRLLLSLLLLSACQKSNFPSEQEASKFCLIVEDAINNGGSEFINKIFDQTLLIDAVTKNIDAPDYYKDGFKEGFMQAYSLGEILTSSQYNSGTTTFLGLKKYTNDTIIGLYRTNLPTGLNYQEVYFNADSEGQMHIFDLYSYNQGDKFSESIRNMYVINLASEVPEFSHPLAESIPAINEIAAIADNKEYAQALQKLEELPEEVKKEKIIQIIRLSLANEISDATLNTVAESFKQQFPNDNMVYLKMMELSLEREDKNTILANIDSLDARIGGDAYLKVVKSLILINDAQDQQAESLLNQAIEQAPKQDDAYFTLLNLLIVQKRHAEAIQLFGKMKDNFDINPAEFVVNDNYQEFYDSPDFKEWISKNPIDSSSTFMNYDENLNIDSLYQEFLKQQEHDHDQEHDHEH